jgi:hypothetical protein
MYSCIRIQKTYFVHSTHTVGRVDVFEAEEEQAISARARILFDARCGTECEKVGPHNTPRVE